MSDERFPPLGPDDPPDRRANKADPWHVGLMISQTRAVAVASDLFPDEIADGSDCRKEIGRVGEPCSVCAGREWWKLWTSLRVRQVRAALMEAFR